MVTAASTPTKLSVCRDGLSADPHPAFLCGSKKIGIYPHQFIHTLRMSCIVSRAAGVRCRKNRMPDRIQPMHSDAHSFTRKKLRRSIWAQSCNFSNTRQGL